MFYSEDVVESLDNLGSRQVPLFSVSTSMLRWTPAYRTMVDSRMSAGASLWVLAPQSGTRRRI